MEMVDPCGWHRVDADTLKKIRERLANLESMTWREILVDGAKQNHFVTLNKLSNEARDRLEQIGQGDVDELVSLRITGKERVWGIMEVDVLKVLWWDPQHTIYPSPKKHT